MITLDITHDQAEEVLLALGRHLPARTDFGRPLVVQARAVLCTRGNTTTWYFIEPDGVTAIRTNAGRPATFHGWVRGVEVPANRPVHGVD